MSQQSQIMKLGASYALTCTAANTTYSQVLSNGCRYVRITASGPARYQPANASVSLASATSGVYAPGTTYGPDIIDVDGITTIYVASSAAATVVYITEMSA